MNTMLETKECSVLCALLAGGRSSRMGKQNKALLPWGGGILIEAIIKRLSCERENMVISSNDNHDRLQQLKLSLIPDDFGSYAGPLAGISALMQWSIEHRPKVQYIVLSSCDTPFIPTRLVQTLIGEAKGEEKLILPQSSGRIHPLHGLWSVSLLDDLNCYLAKGQRRVMAFTKVYDPKIVIFNDQILDDGIKIDPFTNINTVEEYQRYKDLAMQ